jgi:hypothetical protein
VAINLKAVFVTQSTGQMEIMVTGHCRPCYQARLLPVLSKLRRGSVNQF